MSKRNVFLLEGKVINRAPQQQSEDPILTPPRGTAEWPGFAEWRVSGGRLSLRQLQPLLPQAEIGPLLPHLPVFQGKL